MAVQSVSQSLSSQLREFKYILLPSLTAGLDYSAISRMVLTFTPSVTEINISVTITDDDLAEMNKNFFGELTTDTGGVILDPAEAEISILDDDAGECLE